MKKTKNKLAYLLMVFVMLLMVLLAVRTVSSVFAQESGWSDPFNLSNSGGTTNPFIISDAFNRIHVFWRDDFAGLVYTQGSEVGWTSPAASPLPFITPDGVPLTDQLQLVADSQGQIHAGWLDSDGILFYSRVNGKDFGVPGAWRTPAVIALSSADFGITVAPDGKVHIAFIRNIDEPDFPAGVYARANIVNSDVWSTPRLVYRSQYFRGIGPGNAQLSMAADNSGHVYLAWDETSQERISMAISQDSGNIWADPQVVDSRQPSDGGASGPSQPVLLLQNGVDDGSSTLLITWQAGHQGTNCAQHYRTSQDNGATWSELSRIPEPFNQSCPLRLQSMQAAQGTWLALTNQNGLYLTAWDPQAHPDDQWSLPVLQTTLNGFNHPETFRPVSLACRAITYSQEMFHTVACENDKNGDIWYFSRFAGDTETWFPQPTATPIWSTPAPISAATQTISVPALVHDPLGRLHVFWTQESSGSIYYALWDGTIWSSPVSIINSPGGNPGNPSVIIHPTGALMLIWADAAVESVYFSQAPYSQAYTASSWDTPQSVPFLGLIAMEPQLTLGVDGNVILAAAVPLNEGRGLYILSGTNQNQAGQPLTWSDPVLVFDAIQAGWDSLSDPRIAITPQGQIHLMWTRRSLPPAFEPTGLYATHSSGIPGDSSSEQVSIIDTDWSPVEEVMRGTLKWSSLSSVSSPDTLHRIWQQTTAGQPVLLHSVSSDQGNSWSDANQITGLENTSGPAGLSPNPAGGLDLVQVTERNTPGSLPGWELVRWQWSQESAWVKTNSQDIPNLISPTAVAISSDPQSGIAALFSGTGLLDDASENEDGSGIQVTPEPSYALLYMGRQDGTLEIGSEEQLPEASEATEVQPEETNGTDAETGVVEITPETLIPTPTPQPSFTQQSPGFLQSLLSNSFSGIALGIFPAVIILAVIFIVAARRIIIKK